MAIRHEHTVTLSFGHSVKAAEVMQFFDHVPEDADVKVNVTPGDRQFVLMKSSITATWGVSDARQS